MTLSIFIAIPLILLMFGMMLFWAITSINPFKIFNSDYSNKEFQAIVEAIFEAPDFKMDQDMRYPNNGMQYVKGNGIQAQMYPHMGEFEINDETNFSLYQKIVFAMRLRQVTGLAGPKKQKRKLASNTAVISIIAEKALLK